MNKLALLIGLLVAQPVYAECFAYRKDGGEVTGASVDAYNFPAEGYYSEVCDPTAPNGTNLVPPKIWDGSELRNATAQEIAAFPADEAAEILDKAKVSAKARLDAGDRNGIVIKALALVVLDEVNLLRADAGLAQRTKTQLLNAVKGKIDADLAN